MRFKHIVFPIIDRNDNIEIVQVTKAFAGEKWHVYIYDAERDPQVGGQFTNWSVTTGKRWDTIEDVVAYLSSQGWEPFNGWPL